MARRHLEVKKGAWIAEEDTILINYVQTHGPTRWGSLPFKTGLNRCARSCRRRWFNHLRPEIKKDPISADEEELIIRMHRLLGNRWSLIAGRIPGRTENQIKNYWNTLLRKRFHNATSNSKFCNTKRNGSFIQMKEDCCSFNFGQDKQVCRPLPYKPVSSCNLDVVRCSEEQDTSKLWNTFFEDSLMWEVAEDPFDSVPLESIPVSSVNLAVTEMCYASYDLDSISVSLSFSDIGLKDFYVDEEV